MTLFQNLADEDVTHSTLARDLPRRPKRPFRIVQQSGNGMPFVFACTAKPVTGIDTN